MNRSLLIVSIVFSLCMDTQAQAPEEKEETIYVVSISWHTGILVPVYSLPDSIWPREFDTSKADYLEIGWGDRDFYQDLGFNLWYATKAALWPTSSVLHVDPIINNIKEHYKNTEVVKLQVSCEELEALSQYILEHFELNEQGKAISLQQGIAHDSYFFAGSSKYYFPKNSNVWAAKALKQAGFSNPTMLLQTTGMVINKAEKYGEKVER